MDTQVKNGIEEGLANFTARYELDESVVTDLKQMLLAALKQHVKAPAAVASSKGESKNRQRRKTGYNLYIRAQFEADKAANADKDGDAKGGANSQALMAKFSKQWKGLSDEDKQPYVDQAEAINAQNGAEAPSKNKSGKGKKLTGYNLFYREHKDEIRAENEQTKEHPTFMKAVGAKWTALSKEEKAEYSARAAAESSADE